MPNRKIKTLVWCAISVSTFLLSFGLLVKTLPPSDHQKAIDHVQEVLINPLENADWEGHQHPQGIVVKNSTENAIWLVKNDFVHCLNDNARRLSVPMLRRAGMSRGKRPAALLPFR